MLYLQAVKEYVQEHRLRKVLMDTAEENGDEVDDDLAVADLDDDDDMDDEDGEISYQGVSEQTSVGQTLVQSGEQQFEPVHQPQLEHVQEHHVQEIVIAAPQQQQQQVIQEQLSSQPITIPVLPTPVSQIPVQTTPIHQSVLPPQKSILKAQGSHEDTVPSTPISVGSKKVRLVHIILHIL